MAAPLVEDPVVKRFRAALTDLYGDRPERVVLFGSRARGDAREDSDYDIAVFIKDLGPFWDEVDRLVDVETDLLYDTGAVINSMPYRAGAYHDRTSLMREIRREGVDL
jgi:predicted nucleotidyltransferase